LISSRLARAPDGLERVIRTLLPFLAILIETLLLITYVEGFSMFLPRLLGVTT
jgi:TRAP-type C4-dicarboxylate transport system permease large subunit